MSGRHIMMNQLNNNQPESIFFLSDVIDAHVFFNGKEIGHLIDFIITSKEKVAEATHVVISRPFGDPSLIVPWIISVHLVPAAK